MSKKLKYYPIVPGLATWAKRALEDANMKQVDLVKETGSDQTFISSLLRGKSKLIEASKWSAIRAAFVAHGQECPENIDPEKVAPDEKSIFARYTEIKKTTEASWKTIAQGAGIHTNTLQNFMNKKQVGCETLLALEKGLKKYEELPTKLVEQKAIVPKPVAKTSIIQPAPSASMLPSELELDLRELELIARVRRHLQPTAVGLNGVRAK